MKDCVMTFIKHNYELCLNYISWGQTLNHQIPLLFIWLLKWTIILIMCGYYLTEHKEMPVNLTLNNRNGFQYKFQ
jgi:hypothetical protein